MLTMRHYPNLPATAAAACRTATDQYLLPAGPTAANMQQWVCCCESMLGQTDGPTDEMGHHTIT